MYDTNVRAELRILDNTNVKAEFRIMGDNFDVNEITKALGIAPTQTWNMGEPIRQTGKRYKYTLWMFATEPEETLDIYTPLKKIEKMFIDPPAIYLKSPIIEFAAKIGAMIDMDTYVN